MKRIFLCVTIFFMISSLAQAMEPKIPVGQILISETKSFGAGDYRGAVTVKESTDNVTVYDFDYGPNGTVEIRIIRQEFPDGTSVQELDESADGIIERRTTVLKPDVSVVLFERELLGGRIERKRNTMTETEMIIEVLDADGSVINTYTYEK